MLLRRHGICKIVPPENYKPKCNISAKMQFEVLRPRLAMARGGLYARQPRTEVVKHDVCANTAAIRRSATRRCELARNTVEATRCGARVVRHPTLSILTARTCDLTCHLPPATCHRRAQIGFRTYKQMHTIASFRALVEKATTAFEKCASPEMFKDLNTASCPPLQSQRIS